jgi:hypothetical protein
LRAWHCRGEWRSPGHGRSPDAPTIETIVPMDFYEIINGDELVKSKKPDFSVIPAKAGIKLLTPPP